MYRFTVLKLIVLMSMINFRGRTKKEVNLELNKLQLNYEFYGDVGR